MKLSRAKYALALVLFSAPLVLTAAREPTGYFPRVALTDSGTIRIHLLGHAIGSERYVIRQDGASLALIDSFGFTDRGGKIQLASELHYTPKFEPLKLRSVGRSYRFVNIDADVVVNRDHAIVKSLGDSMQASVPHAFFTVAGYAPLEIQALLIRYWEAHGRPTSIGVVPGNPVASVKIEDRGRRRFDVNGKASIPVHRYSIDGVAWGREIVYLDSESKLAAIVTRANLLPLEGVREDLIAERPALLDSISADAARSEVAAAAKAATIPTIATGDFALVGARIVDGTTGPPIEDGVIVVNGDRIEAVGPRSSTTIPRGTKVIDVHGKTIIPGLWDMHAHVALPEWGAAYLGVGVTTIRDMGGEVRFLTAFREALASHQVPGPRLLLAGLVDGSGPEAFGTIYADTPDQGRAVVDMYHAAGFQQMKLYTLIKPDVAGAIIRHAHEVGMTVTGHVPRAMTLQSMVDSGTDNVAHLPVRGDTSSETFKRQVRMLAAKHVVIDPTVSWNELLGHSMQQSLVSFQPGFAEAPWPLRSSYGSVRNAGDSAATNRSLRASLGAIKALHEAGVPIVAGTDYGLPGFSLLRELELYVEAGFTPLEAIQAATVVPAEVMKLTRESGTIEVSKRADLVVLDADPLADIHNIRSGRWVVTRGVMFDMAALRKSVGFLKPR